MADFSDGADTATEQLDILPGKFFTVGHNDGRFLGRCSFILHGLQGGYWIVTIKK